MATIESINMAQKALQNVTGLRLDMRHNSQGYRARVESGALTSDQAFTMMQRDVFQYRRRLRWMSDIQESPARRTMLRDGLNALGLSDPTEIISETRSLMAATDALAGTPDASALGVRTDALLATLRAYDGVW